MQITVYGVIKTLPVQTVSLAHNKKDPDNTYLFHCPYCGQSLTQIKGTIQKIFPGLEPTGDVVTINRCPQCHRAYTFQTSLYKNAKTKIVLMNLGAMVVTFNCFICRTPLLQFKDRYCMDMEGKALPTFPFSIKCPKADCVQNYDFLDVV